MVVDEIQKLTSTFNPDEIKQAKKALSKSEDFRWLVSFEDKIVVCPYCNFVNQAKEDEIVKITIGNHFYSRVLVDTTCQKCGKKISFIALQSDSVLVRKKIGYFEDNRKAYMVTTYKKLYHINNEKLIKYNKGYIVDTVTYIDIVNLNNGRMYAKYKRPKSKKWKFDKGVSRQIYDIFESVFKDKIVLRDSYSPRNIVCSYGVTYRGKFINIYLTDTQKRRLKKLFPSLKERNYDLTAKEFVEVLLGKRYIKSSKLENFPYKALADIIFLYSWFYKPELNNLGYYINTISKLVSNPHDLMEILFYALYYEISLQPIIRTLIFMNKRNHRIATLKKLLYSLSTDKYPDFRFKNEERFKYKLDILKKRFPRLLEITRLKDRYPDDEKLRLFDDVSRMLFTINSEYDNLPDNVINAHFRISRPTDIRLFHDAVTGLYMYVTNPELYNKEFDFSQMFIYENRYQLIEALTVRPINYKIGIRPFLTYLDLYTHAQKMGNCSYSRKDYNCTDYVLFALTEQGTFEDVGTLQLKFKKDKDGNIVGYYIDEVKWRFNKPLSEEDHKHLEESLNSMIRTLQYYNIRLR